MKHTKSYIAGHPNPQFTRKEFEVLDGEWDFCFGTLEDNEEKFVKKFPNTLKIRVPYAYRSEASGIGCEEIFQSVWYRKSFDFSQKMHKKERLILHFEGADHHTRVWVNGKYVGENFGGYVRFSFDIAPFLAAGKAEIVVRCIDTYSCTQARGKQKWDRNVFGCWYTETTGIWKSVWAEFLSCAYVERVKITPNTDDYFVQFDYSLPFLKDDLQLKTVVSFDGRVIAEDTVSVKRNEFSRKIDITSEADFFKRRFWFSHLPDLYDVEYILYEKGKETDRVCSYFGLVKYATEKDNITVNDYPVYLKMTLDQGYFPGGWLTPDEEQIVRDILLTKEIGLNGIRKHQKIEDERFYYYCDILGVYVWLEMPSYYEFNDSAMENFTVQWTRILRQYENHPCIMALVPFNESWGVQRIFSDRRQQTFTEGIYYLSKSLLPGKLVISNDGWEHTKSDIVTLHNYAERGEQLNEVYSDLNDILQNKKTKAFPHKFIFAEGYKYEGQPVVVSEFAGIAFEKDKQNGWGYGNMVKDEEEFLSRLGSLIDAIRSQPKFSGYCITQTTDVQHEINGLYDFNRKLKVDKEKLTQIFLR